ncbi:phosphoribosylformylglycinamidine synthase [Blattabacterium cuenoti]|uniref:phosphoribosylformylglycinamidine synthase n=1 Tax=Blattabacterium cuenoti TaxID=1653831 RepID=UPI00163C9222|nr:phosphoribosylformylglycinamidine synthase [Blattabacterium cuenoti]
MNLKIYIKKKNCFDIYSKELYQELQNLFKISSLYKIIVYQTYDILNVTNKSIFFKDILYKVFVDPVTDVLYTNINLLNPYFEYNIGEYNCRAEAATQCVKIIYPQSKIRVKTGKLIELFGIQNKKDFFTIKNYCSYTTTKKKKKKNNIPSSINFIHLTYYEIKNLHQYFDFSIDIDDLLFIQKYFRYEERRNPTELELRVLDTYWSDHCRHTTFLSSLIDIQFTGCLKKTYHKIFDEYQKDRRKYCVDKKSFPNLMELSTLPSKILLKKRHSNHFVSKENNACTILIDVDIVGKKNIEKWYLLFKNETHNHPTEINPFWGAATCIGGAIRDPLSGRAFVYQSIRLSGAANPTINKTLLYSNNKKISQYKICRDSAYGYSSYGNQIGVPTSHINEIYHEGFIAKRMEIGMVIGAVPVNYVNQKTPQPGDIIVLLGGLTGKEGIGGATDSSKKEHNISQNILKNNLISKLTLDPITERKIQRLFRKKKVTSLIKKCNDFGAGGASVAIGELCDSIELYLDKIPVKKKFTNFTPVELALSESQERMAIVLDPSDLKNFLHFANEENLLAIPIATVMNNKRIIFYHRKKQVLNLKSDFLNSGGVEKKRIVHINSPLTISPFKQSKNVIFNKYTFLNTISKLNVASQKSLVEMFDSTVGGTTVLMPFGGKFQMTPSEGSVHKIPVLNGETNTVSLASWGYHPDISLWSPLHGGAYAIIECISKIVSMGGNYKHTYLSFQEYYQKLENDPSKWGIPFASLLGAYKAQKELGIVSIGGKDSMSGTYQNIHVPPTFVAFGVCIGSSVNIISPEFKKVGNKIYLYHHKPKNNDEMPDFQSIKNAYIKIHKEIVSGKIISAQTVKEGGIAIAISKMAFGNRLGVVINSNTHHLLETHIGSLILEANSTLENKEFILIGKIVDSKYLNFNSVKINIEEAILNWEKTLNPIYNNSFLVKNKANRKNNVNKHYVLYNTKINKRENKTSFKYKVKVRVFIPIFPGTNCELESIRAFENEGAIVITSIFKNLKYKDLIDSIQELKNNIKSSQILMICGGFTYGDEPDGAGKFITSILHNQYIKETIEFLLNKDGLILGICNGFQALIKSGLLPYGKIQLRNYKSPTLTYNELGKHVSQCVRIKVISDNSPWLKGMKNKIYIQPLSHGEGRFYANKKITDILFKKNQIATQYVNFQGTPTLDKAFNPNGSLQSVEGLLNENGKIYGKMTHPERFKHGLLKNIPNIINEDSIFKNAVEYFV